MSALNLVEVDRLKTGRRRRADARPAEVAEAVRQMNADGISITKIARTIHCGHGVVARLLRESRP